MSPSILIADDYEDNRELLRLILEPIGYHIREASNGRECVTMAQEEPPDLAFIDISMPELDGYGAVRELRANERTRHIKCIAITAFTDAERTHAIKKGFDAYLTKPFRSKEILATVERMLDGQQQDKSACDDKAYRAEEAGR